MNPQTTQQGRGSTACAAIMLLVLWVSLAGCERAMHEMYEQPKYKPLTPSSLFANGNASRPQVPGTVARSAGALAGSQQRTRTGHRVPLPARCR